MKRNRRSTPLSTGRRTAATPAAWVRCGLLLGVLLATGAARAQSAQLQIEENEYFVNESFTADVIVNQFEKCEPPEFPEIANCKVEALPGGSDTMQTYIVNGRMTQTRSHTYRFELTPTKAGELVIPPITVRADGKSIETKSRRVMVQASAAVELLFAELSCPVERAYVGQRVSLTLTIFVKPAVALTQRLDGQNTYQFFEADSFLPFPPPKRLREVQRESPEGGKVSYYAYETTTDYIVSRPGPLALDDLVIRMNYPTRFSRDVFGDTRVTSFRKLRAVPRAAAVEVLPLPMDGRPANFGGAVGQFTINVTAKPTTARVGDPIELTIDLRGEGPIDSLPPPPLASDRRLTEAFRVPQETLAGEMQGDRKRYKQVIRPLRADIREVPPLEYPYFDPASGQYAVALSAPIPLKITPGERLEAADLPKLPMAEKPTQPAIQPLDGLRGNKTADAELFANNAAPSAGALLAATGVPPAVFASVWGWQLLAQRRGGTAARRRRLALRTAQQRLDKARALPPRERCHQIGTALAGYLADRLNEPQGRFVGTAAAELLRERGVNGEVVSRLVRVLTGCEAASFGGGVEGDAAALADEAGACLTALERERL